MLHGQGSLFVQGWLLFPLLGGPGSALRREQPWKSSVVRRPKSTSEPGSLPVDFRGNSVGKFDPEVVGYGFDPCVGRNSVGRVQYAAGRKPGAGGV